MQEVCAVIVTYNRADLLCRCLEHLFQQDYPLDILVYDNHSTVDTKGKLGEAGLLRENVCYYYAESNTGGSGGFYYGMEIAVKKGYRYLWLMDDDGYPMRTDTLSRLMADIPKLAVDDFALNSLVVQNDEGSKVSFAVHQVYDVKRLREQAEKGLIYGEIMPFNGTLVSSMLVKKIGYPIKEFFVYGDENEYFLRIKQSGAKMAIDVNSLYRHPTNVEKVVKFFGKNIYYMKMPCWKVYCAARNKTYIAKKYFGLKGVLDLTLKDILYLIAVPGDRVGRMMATIQGRKDGLIGYFGRKIDFSK